MAARKFDVKRVLQQASQVAVSPMLWFLLTAFGGAALVAHGVNILAGSGWASVAGGVFLLLGAAFISRGMNA